jgi:hypothetical protein
MSEPPSLEQFKQCARREFSYLVNDFGFEEVSLPHQAADDFLVCFASEEICLAVEGVNWGQNAMVCLWSLKESAAAWQHPLRAGFDYSTALNIGGLIRRRASGESDSSKPRKTQQAGGQLEQISEEAGLIRAYAADVLRGNTEVLPATTGVPARTPQARAQDKAMSRAGHAFKAKEYRQVIELLTPFEGTLTPAQQRKLEYARKNV